MTGSSQAPSLKQIVRNINILVSGANMLGALLMFVFPAFIASPFCGNGAMKACDKIQIEVQKIVGVTVRGKNEPVTSYAL